MKGVGVGKVKHNGGENVSQIDSAAGTAANKQCEGFCNKMLMAKVIPIALYEQGIASQITYVGSKT